MNSGVAYAPAPPRCWHYDHRRQFG